VHGRINPGGGQNQAFPNTSEYFTFRAEQSLNTLFYLNKNPGIRFALILKTLSKGQKNETLHPDFCRSVVPGYRTIRRDARIGGPD
jgi:hypothetical protein